MSTVHLVYQENIPTMYTNYSRLAPIQHANGYPSQITTYLQNQYLLKIFKI